MERGRAKYSLQSLAESLTGKPQRSLKSGKNFKNASLSSATKGRIRCDCQARVHGLVRNCLSCGRIVCSWEGSGPCLFCGDLVCTRDEKKILEENSIQSSILYSQLMGETVTNTNFGNKDCENHTGLNVARNLQSKLLKADADVDQRNLVHDLECDYHNLENSIYLTLEEREAIIARKKEIEELRERQKRLISINIHLDEQKFSETNSKHHIDGPGDPVIRSIIDKSAERLKQSPNGSDSTKQSFINFNPKYDRNIGRIIQNVDADGVWNCDNETLCSTNDRMMYAYVERRGFAITLPQPLATLLVRGIRRHIPWLQEINLRGPLIIGADTIKTSQENFMCCISKTGTCGNYCESDFPLGVIVGRAMLCDVLSLNEYRNSHCEGECAEVKEGFILIFNVFESLLTPIPHMPCKDDVYHIDSHLKSAVDDILLSQQI